MNRRSSNEGLTSDEQSLAGRKPIGIRDLLDLAWPFRASLSILVILAMASAGLTLAVPWFAGQLLGGLIRGVAIHRDFIVAVLLLCLTGTALFNFGIAFLSARIGSRLLADLRQQVFEHVQHLPLGFHESRGKGDTLALMTYEIRRLSDFLTQTLVVLPARVIMTVGAVVLMLRIDARLALFVPILIPVFYLILKLLGRSLRGLAGSIQHAEAQIVEIAEESLAMLPATKAFTRERQASSRYREATDVAAELAIREGRIYALLEPLIGLLAAVAAIFVLVLAGHGIETGRLSPQGLFSFLFYSALLTRPVSALAHVYGQTQSARGTLARLREVLDQPVENLAPPGKQIARAKGAIRYEAVEFAYPGREDVLTGVTLDIEPGEILALVGANGAGKTAMINLLLRYYEPNRGTILIDEKDIATLDVAAVRRQVGLVPQSPLLFNGTIRDNISFGAHDPSPAAIDQAARIAQATEFIADLRLGMDTVIGDAGVRLSGGQRQRISLARALIKDPPILVFDEATSMFDDEGERDFIASSAEALAGRTVIVVTHRPATLALADRIVTLEGGTIVESMSGRS